jgi:glycosyltransferase involved in cell wall biosynthesis
MLTLALFSHSRYLCGAERMLLNLALLLERSGTIRPVLLVPGEGELACEARSRNLACHIIPAPPWYIVPPGDVNDYRSGLKKCCEALKGVLVDFNSDAVLVNTLTNVPAMLAAVELDIPSLVWVHGVIDSLLLPARSSVFAAPHDELLLHSATRVIALSNYTSRFCSQVMGRTRLDVIHNWTPVDPHFTPPPDKYRSRQFACLNTFDPHKGHATLLEAAALLKARNHFFELHLYGDGQVRGEMESMAARLGLQSCVRFRGRTSNVDEVYDRSLAIVNPAQVEPFGMTLIEAMARKTPVVATRAGGPDDIVVHGECGYLVDRGDAAAIARHMQALLESPELARQLGEAGFQRVASHFHEDAARAAFLPVIEEAVRDFRGYEPAVKALSRVYQLWLDQAAGNPVYAAPASPAMASSVGKAARFAQRGMRRTKALGKRVLSALGIGGAGSSAINAAFIQNVLPGPSGAKVEFGPSGPPRRFQPVRRKTLYRFIPEQGNWAGIDLLVGRDPSREAGRLRLRVQALSGQVLREAISPLCDVGEKGWVGFRFAPIVNAAGMTFELEITTEDSSPAAVIAICEGEPGESAGQSAAARLGLSRQSNKLYCKTWHA